MRRDEHRPTVIDYLVAAVCPLLIVALVQSLALFIGEVVYRGEHAPHLRWTLFWFGLGMVGVSRIAIERTRMYAGLYALGLGAATALLLSYFFQMNWVAWLILGFIWWCADKLTFDTTLVDEDEDASGEGLLDVAGVDDTTDDEPAEKPRPATRASPWRRVFLNDPGKKERPHAPGLWVIYFLVGALPVFAAGHVVLRQTGDAAFGLFLAMIYYTAGLALLMLTSLLGLRRYLRQRRLKMPGAMAGAWIGTGAFICGVVILGSLLLPRPGVMVADTSGFESVLRHIDRETANQMESEEGRESESNGDAPEPSESNASPSGDGQSAGETAPRSETPGSASPSDGLNLLALLKLLVWIVAGVALLVFVIRHGAAIWAAILELWESLKNIFRPPERERRKAASLSRQPDVRAATFASCENPFRARPADDPVRTVVLTFEAVQAWAGDQDLPRKEDMTEHEFIRAVAAAHPELRDDLRMLVRLYSGIVYAERAPQPDELPPLESLWRSMESQAVNPVR